MTRLTTRVGGALRHPVERGDQDERGSFDRFAERASFLVSSPLFFVACLTLIASWTIGLLVGASTRLESTLAALMSAVTLLLVAVLKNAELRADRAVQLKLDAIASSLLDDKRGALNVSTNELETAIGVHEQI
jgi:low affinity Fe/Cu permease